MMTGKKTLPATRPRSIDQLHPGDRVTSRGKPVTIATIAIGDQYAGLTFVEGGGWMGRADTIFYLAG